MTSQSRPPDAATERAARRDPSVVVAGTAETLDFVRRAVALIGRRWTIAGIDVTAEAVAELRDSRVDALLIPIEYLAGSPEFAEASKSLDAALVPYRLGTSTSSPASSSARTPANAILSLATVSPSRLVAAIEESIERWAHTRALRADDGPNASLDSQIEFLSAVNHEVRTPLNAILGMADFLAESDLAPDQAEKVRIIRSSGRDLLCVLEQLVDLARLRGGEMRHRNSEVDLEALLHEVADNQSMSIHRKGLGLSVVIDNSLPSLVLGNRARLAQVISILVRNALRMTIKGEIRIAARPDPEWTDPNVVRFEVSHTGDAIAHQEATTSSDDSLSVSRDHAGLGIGIALADGLVRAMGGRLSFEDEGRSIRFTQIFQPLAVRRSEASQTDQLHGVRAMVVSPNESERRGLVSVLEASGALVGQATNRQQAFEAALVAERTDLGYELILIDEEHCEPKLIGEFGRIPNGGPKLIAISHASGPVASPALARSGVEFVLRTPQTPEDLLRAIQAIQSGDPEPGCTVSLAGAQTERILLVDDSPENRRLICMYLKDSGFQIDEASDGHEALEAVGAADYALILMDIQMPGMNGYQATTAIRELERTEQRAGVPIIALTAFSMDEDVERSLEAGCDDHLNKPIEKSTLLATIDQHRRLKAKLDDPSVVATSLDDEIGRMGPAFLENRLVDAARISKAARQGRWEEARIAGHRMCGSAKGYGFPEISALGQQIEAAARALDGEALEALAFALEQICQQSLDDSKPVEAV